MEGKADLHMHSVHSDGTLTVESLVRRAHAAGVRVMSLTDHDSVGGVDEAITRGGALGVDVFPGVELSATTADGREVHLLGYCFNHSNAHLLHHLDTRRSERLGRAGRIVGRLHDLGIPLTLEAVLRQAGAGSVGRPHIAQALVAEGLTVSYHEAFQKYIGRGGPAFEERDQVSVADAVRLIADAGGLSFIAHPGDMEEERLQEVIAAGISGIEVVHPSHTPERMMFYHGVVTRHGLLESGGSDFHAPSRNGSEALGKFWIPMERAGAIREHAASITGR